MDCGNSESLNITGAITLEAWINIKNFTDAGYLLARNLASPSSSMQYGIYLDAGEIVNIVAEQNIWNTGKIITIGEWTHLVALYKSGSYRKLYLNGVYQTETTCPTISSRNWKLLIGARNDNGAQAYHFNGLIDEVAIFDIALTAEEIKKRYQAGRP